MKKMLVVLLSVLMALIAFCAGAEEAEPTVYTSGDWEYVLLEDGTAEITGYTGTQKDLTIPDVLDGYSVTAIGDRAFSDDALTSVVIPDSVTEVGVFPFTGEEWDAELRVNKSTLTSIHLGSGVTNLFWASNMVSMFHGPAYPTLAVITVSPDNPVYTVENGLLIDKVTSAVVCCPAAMTGEAIVPDWVTVVGDYAFAKASASYVYIPDSVTDVGEYVFLYSTSGRIRLPGSLDMTFAKSDGDEKKLFPEAITDMRMQTLLEGLTKKEARTIQDAYKRTGVDPATGKSYYRKTDDIAALEAAYPALKEEMVWILRNPDMKANAIVKLNDVFAAAGYTEADLVLDYELVTGRPYPEEQRHPLAAHLPYTLKCLDRKLSLPEGCELENLQGGLALIWAAQQGYTLVDVMVGGDFAYTLQTDGTARIVGYFGETETVRIPAEMDGHAVTAISDGAVSDIAVMVRAGTLPDAGPVGGTEISRIVIPDSLTDITGNPFRGLSGLTTIEVTQEHPTLALIDGVLYEKPNKRLVCYPAGLGRTSCEVPRGITIIGADSFYGCKALMGVTLPDTVMEIGSGAFDSCTGLMSLTLPEGLQKIGANAFYGCTGLTSLTLPEGLQKIGANAFYGCRGLTSLMLPVGLQEIGANAFYGCRGLTSLTLPDGLKKIGKGAFEGCRGLTSIVLPESLQEIGVYAFGSCYDLTSLTLPAMPYERWDRVFAQCHELTHIVIPDGFSMTYRAEQEFFFNLYALRTIEVSQEHPTLALIDGVLIDKPTKKLVRYPAGLEKTSYEIPRGIRSISGHAFNGCTILTNVAIPDTVTEIGECAFAGCTGLTSITLPDGLTEIGEGVFADCSSLTSITLPEGLTRIGRWSFERCVGLTEMHIPASVTDISPDAFTGCSDSLTLTIERDSAAVRYCKEKGIRYVYSDYLDWLLD